MSASLLMSVLVKQLARDGEVRLPFWFVQDYFTTFLNLWDFCQRAQVRIASELNPRGERFTLIYRLMLY